jgi:hypothetical protein
MLIQGLLDDTIQTIDSSGSFAVAGHIKDAIFPQLDEEGVIR